LRDTKDMNDSMFIGYHKARKRGLREKIFSQKVSAKCYKNPRFAKEDGDVCAPGQASGVKSRRDIMAESVPRVPATG
jgi:hypothetical protein